MSVCLSFPIKLPIKPELQRTPEPNKLGLPQNIIITKKMILILFEHHE